jgi:hypothetical protein
LNTRWLACAALSCAVAIGALRAARAAEDPPAPVPSATLRVSAKQVAAGAGFSWGGGVLSYDGKEYNVTVDGLTVGTVGVTSIDATGEVYELKKLEDFPGTYFAAVAGSTIGGGGAKLVMRNQNGVVMHVQATTIGVGLTIGVSGLKVALAN